MCYFVITNKPQWTEFISLKIIKDWNLKLGQKIQFKYERISLCSLIYFPFLWNPYVHQMANASLLWVRRG